MITLVAEIKAKKGHEKDLETVLTGLVKKVGAEDGTLEYILYTKDSDPSMFMFYEIYKDKDALSLHGSTPYFKAAMKEMAPFVDGPAGIATYTELGRISR